MMKRARLMMAAAVAAVGLTGCFTLHEAEPVTAQMSRLPEGRNVSVALSGFDATITDYVPVYGYETVYVDGGHYHGRGRHYYHPGHYQTVTTETLVPQIHPTEAFRQRARDLMEDSGFLLRALPADYNVEVTFEGPFITDGQRGVQWAWMLCSVFSAEYSVQTWNAKLRIYDNKTKRVVFTRDYSQKYDNVAWSPIFFIGLAGYTRNSFNAMQSWCLTALTDRMVADATAFLAAR